MDPGASENMNYTYSDIAKMIDHSLLNPTLTADEFEKGCKLAVAYDVASVCILPYALHRCAEILNGSDVKASTTIGFPHGANTTVIKVAEAKEALADGGQELDMVANISAVLSGRWDYVRDDIRAVADLTHAAGQKVKAIFENCYLTDDQKIRLCEICGELRADWVKTSTGYGSGGATLEDLALMRKHSPPHVQVKAAGGVRDLDTLLRVRDLGVTRCGATRTQAMLDECRKRLDLSPIDITEKVTTPAGY
jgi:deoxyribose-phosphate aldolase